MHNASIAASVQAVATPSAANPNLLELLFMPADCVQICSAEMETMIQLPSRASAARDRGTVKITIIPKDQSAGGLAPSPVDGSNEC